MARPGDALPWCHSRPLLLTDGQTAPQTAQHRCSSCDLELVADFDVHLAADYVLAARCAATDHVMAWLCAAACFACCRPGHRHRQVYGHEQLACWCAGCANPPMSRDLASSSALTNRRGSSAPTDRRGLASCSACSCLSATIEKYLYTYTHMHMHMPTLQSGMT